MNESTATLLGHRQSLLSFPRFPLLYNICTRRSSVTFSRRTLFSNTLQPVLVSSAIHTNKGLADFCRGTLLPKQPYIRIISGYALGLPINRANLVVELSSISPDTVVGRKSRTTVRNRLGRFFLCILDVLPLKLITTVRSLGNSRPVQSGLEPILRNRKRTASRPNVAPRGLDRPSKASCDVDIAHVQ